MNFISSYHCKTFIKLSSTPHASFPSCYQNNIHHYQLIVNTANSSPSLSNHQHGIIAIIVKSSTIHCHHCQIIIIIIKSSPSLSNHHFIAIIVKLSSSNHRHHCQIININSSPSLSIVLIGFLLAPIRYPSRVLSLV